MRKRYEVGLEKLATTESSVADMQQELIALQPQLEVSTKETEAAMVVRSLTHSFRHNCSHYQGSWLVLCVQNCYAEIVEKQETLIHYHLGAKLMCSDIDTCQVPDIHARCHTCKSHQYEQQMLCRHWQVDGRTADAMQTMMVSWCR